MIREVIEVKVTAVFHLGCAIEIVGEDGSGAGVSGDQENLPRGIDMDANAWTGHPGDFHGCQGARFSWL